MVPIWLSFLSALISIEVSPGLLLVATACMWLIFIVILIYSLWWHKKDHKLLLQNVQKQSLRKNASQPVNIEAVSGENAESGDDRDELLRRAIYSSFVRLMTEEKIYCDSQLTRDQVISRLGTSRKMFLEMLHQYVKMNFTDCINSYRLDKAIFLLENTEYTNEAIAEEVGFSPNTFYRQFRIKYGISPSEYKKTKCPNPAQSADSLSM